MTDVSLYDFAMLLSLGCSLVPIAHYDSSHNDRKELHKSHYEFDVCMGGGRIIFASRGHKIPAKSAAEDEYMTAFHCFHTRFL